MTKEVYLFDNGEAIEVRNIDTDEMLYKFSYMDNGVLIWNKKDAWRRIRELHLRQDLYKEVWKCKCGKVLKIQDKFEVRCGEVNNIEFDLECSCGNKITIECDTLRVKG